MDIGPIVTLWKRGAVCSRNGLDYGVYLSPDGYLITDHDHMPWRVKDADLFADDWYVVRDAGGFDYEL